MSTYAKILITLLMLLCPAVASAAVFTAVTSGNWNSGTTWGHTGNTIGVDYPGATDTIAVNKGVTVAVNSSQTCGGGTIGVNAGSLTGVARLNITNGATFTINGALAVGSGTANDDGAIGLERGSNIALNATLSLNNSIFETLTGSGWSTVSGTGAITSAYATAASPKQNINLSYVSFQLTGSVTGRLGTQGYHVILFAAVGVNGSTAITNQIVLSHCVFTGSPGNAYATAVGIYIGLGTPASSVQTVDNCDFRDVNVIMSGTGASTSNYWVKNSTFVATPDAVLTLTSTTKAFTIQGNKTLLVEGNYFDGYSGASTKFPWSPTNTGTTWRNNVFTGSASLSKATGLLNVIQSGLNHTFDNNYVFANWQNAHIMSVSGTGGTSGTKITNSIWESRWEDVTGDNVNYIFFNGNNGVATMEVSHNILIGKGNLVGFINSTPLPTGGINNTILVRNNTTYTDTSNNNLATLWQNEGSTTVNGVVTAEAYWLGTLIFQNNLHQGFTNVTPVVSSCFPHVTSPYSQAAVTRGNAYYGATSAYNNITETKMAPNDVVSTTLNATFVAPTRAFITWTAGGAFTASTKTGDTDSTDGSANAKSYLSLINGYDSATKTQVTATASAQGPADLVTWVRAGFAPQSGTLYQTGYSDGTNTTNIGAVDPVDTIAPTVASFSAATPPDDVYTVTLSISATDNFAVTGWYVSESNTPPAVSNPAWVTSVPASYAFAAPGTAGTYAKTLYLWVKDAAGNMSTLGASSTATVSITKTAVVGDNTKPTVTLSLPASSQTPDNVAVTMTANDKKDDLSPGTLVAYCLSDVSDLSSECVAGAGNTGWVTVAQSADFTTATTPVSFTFSARGTRTLRAWFKDSANNISDKVTASISITQLTTVLDLEALKNAILNSPLTEEYAVHGAQPTLGQMLYMIWSVLSGKSISGTTMTTYKIDSVNPAMNFQLNNANNPTVIQRTAP